MVEFKITIFSPDFLFDEKKIKKLIGKEIIKNRIKGRKSLVCGIMKIKTIVYAQKM